MKQRPPIKKETKLAMRDVGPAKMELQATNKEREFVKGDNYWELL